MIIENRNKKSFLSILLQKAIEIFLRKECNKINDIEINIIASSIEILKGKIKNIHILAKGVNYKELIFDEIELKAKQININFKIKRNEILFKNDFTTNFKIKLSEKSLKIILLSNNWNWIGNIISIDLLNLKTLENIKIKNEKIEITGRNIKDEIKVEDIIISSKNGKIYIENIISNKSVLIPIEDKIYINKINTYKNLISVEAFSSINL